ncbi:MAG: hypothetical protein OXS47_02540 [Chloroflexota bacterium]|nr:hypothetical protein [Chloroflexota bacterium]
MEARETHHAGGRVEEYRAGLEGLKDGESPPGGESPPDDESPPGKRRRRRRKRPREGAESVEGDAGEEPAT